MQKNGAGLHTASSCYWDNSTDGESSTLHIYIDTIHVYYSFYPLNNTIPLVTHLSCVCEVLAPSFANFQKALDSKCG